MTSLEFRHISRREEKLAEDIESGSLKLHTAQKCSLHLPAETQVRLIAKPLGWDSSFLLTCKHMDKALCPEWQRPGEGTCFSLAQRFTTEQQHQEAALERVREPKILGWDNCGQRRERSPHLPGEPQAADSRVVQPHDHRVEGQQVLVLLAAVREGGGG